MAIARRSMLLVTMACALWACGNGDQEPVSLIAGLRVLAIQASPPEIAPGEQTQVSATVVDDETLSPPVVTWQACLRPPLPGQSVSPDCLTGSGGAPLLPLGEGPAVTVTMPDLPREAFGLPDSTGGVYLTLVAHVVGARDRLDATYRLRVAAPSTPRNANPQLTTVLVGRGPGPADAAFDEATPLPVHPGDRVRLRASFAPESAERYVVAASAADASSGREATELLTTSWFTTRGELTLAKTSDVQPETELRLGQELPSGTAIDLYAVGRDERGGASVAHRMLVVP